MTVTTVAATKETDISPLRDNIKVNDVSGGKKTRPIFSYSKIGNDEFRGALEISLNSAGLLERTKGEGRYSLDAHLLSVDQPIFGGFSMTVTTNVMYVLEDKESGNELFREVITAEYTAKTSDHVIGAVRLQIANEGAARKNISKLINKLVQLSISQGIVITPH